MVMFHCSTSHCRSWKTALNQLYGNMLFWVLFFFNYFNFLFAVFWDLHLLIPCLFVFDFCFSLPFPPSGRMVVVIFEAFHLPYNWSLSYRKYSIECWEQWSSCNKSLWWVQMSWWSTTRMAVEGKSRKVMVDLQVQPGLASWSWDWVAQRVQGQRAVFCFDWVVSTKHGPVHPVRGRACLFHWCFYPPGHLQQPQAFKVCCETAVASLLGR